MSLMQIPRKIEYALRAMIHLADHPDGVARGAEIAQQEHIPKYYLEKVIRDLMRRGLVRARRGPGGGYQLGRAAHSISFRDVIEAVEGPITLNVCVEGGTACDLQPSCRMFRVWEEGQRVLLEVFSQTTLQEVASSKPSAAIMHRMVAGRAAGIAGATASATATAVVKN
ncbi:MAG: RrF2 family transcriptional regulator [Candidatus Binataceae bacterium]